MRLISLVYALALPFAGVLAFLKINAGDHVGDLTRRADPGDRPISSPEECKCRGDKLLSMIAGQKGLPAIHINYDDLKAAGYEEYPDLNVKATTQLKSALDAIGIPEDGWQDKFFYKEGNSVLAIATVAFEWPPPKDGGIYKISDILYFGYKHMAEQVKAEYKDLKTLFVANCYNKDTEKLVQHYFDGKSKRITDYPGQVFRMTVKEPGLDGKAPEPTDGERWEQEVARAFFGSPNGLVLGWLLINRLDDFKGRTVPSVRVWSQDPLHPQLQLTLEDIKG